VHSRFKITKKEQTDRILKAIKNPHTTILGHMTGRQLQRRPGYEIDIDKILKACAKHGVAVEINAHPWRLDLDWRITAASSASIPTRIPSASSTRCTGASKWPARAACLRNGS
jgi:histidinol phosphatase-like PHP family hydrolase